MKNINNKLLREEEKEIRKRRKKFILNQEIYQRNNRRNLPDQMHSLFSFKFRNLAYQLESLKELERYDGFLSSIGTQLLMSKNAYELEGIIEAPKNSSYKNGIFNFVIEFNNDFPRWGPQIIMKTKIFHKVTDIYRSKNYNLFEEKCQEYIKLYSFNIYEEKLEYFIQNCYDNINDDSIYYFMNAKNMCKYEFEVKCIDDIIKILIDRFENLIDQVLIADNKIYFSLTEIKEIEELPENHKIIIAPKLIQGK